MSGMKIDPVSRRIASGLGRLALALKSRAWRGAADEGITPTQGELLSRLSEQSEGTRLSDLAHQLGISAPTASDAVGTLVAKALVEKQAGSDKRSVTLKVTRSGRKVAARAGDWTDFLADSIATLDEEEQAGFLESLIKIIRNMQERGDISPQRMCITCQHFQPYAHKDAANPHHCGFIGMPFGAASLRLNCADHREAEETELSRIWKRFSE